MISGIFTKESSTVKPAKHNWILGAGNSLKMDESVHLDLLCDTATSRSKFISSLHAEFILNEPPPSSKAVLQLKLDMLEKNWAEIENKHEQIIKLIAQAVDFFHYYFNTNVFDTAFEQYNAIKIKLMELMEQSNLSSSNSVLSLDLENISESGDEGLQNEARPKHPRRIARQRTVLDLSEKLINTTRRSADRSSTMSTGSELEHSVRNANHRPASSIKRRSQDYCRETTPSQVSDSSLEPLRKRQATEHPSSSYRAMVSQEDFSRGQSHGNSSGHLRPYSPAVHHSDYWFQDSARFDRGRLGKPTGEGESWRISTGLRCPLCKGIHELENCAAFYAMTNSQRKSLATRKRLCYTCLDDKCKVETCPWRDRMCDCGYKYHHPLICVPSWLHQ